MATNILSQLINDGAPTKAVELRIGSVSATTSDTFAYQDQHDNFQTNANIQVDDIDVGSGNPVPTTVSAVVPGTDATSLGKAEDAAHASGDTGVMSLAVRNDTLAALAGTDGDYAPLQVNADGALYTAVNPGEAADSLGKRVDNAAGSADIGVAMLGIRNDTLASLVASDGNYAPLQVNADGALYIANGSITTIDTNIASLVQTEDEAHTTGDAGLQMLAVRNDTLAALSSTDGDYSPLQVNAGGALYTSAEVSAIIPGTNAENLGKAEDAAHSSGDTGVMGLAVRNDTLAALADTDGDYTPLQVNSDGALYTVVQQVEAVIPGTAAENLGKAEDSAHSDGDVGVMGLAVRNDTLAALAGTDGDYAPLQVDADGALYTNVTSLTPGTSAANLGKAVDSASGGTDTGVAALAIRDNSLGELTPLDGDYTQLRVGSTGALWVTADTASAALGKACDAASGTGDVGIAPLVVRDDALTTLSQADGDYTQMRVGSTGALWVNDSSANSSLTTISTNTTTISGAIQTEDAAHTTGDSGMLCLGVRNNTWAALSNADGDYNPIEINNIGAVKAALYDESAGTPVAIDANGAMLVGGAGTTSLGKAEDSAHSSGDVGVMSLAVRNDTLAALAGADGDYAPLQVSAAGAVYTHPSKVRTVTEVFNATVNNLASMSDGGDVEIAIPPEVTSGHLYIKSADTTATFTFRMRRVASGDDFTSTLLNDITLSSGSEAHLVSSLEGVAVLTIDYTNSSGSANALEVHWLCEEYQ